MKHLAKLRISTTVLVVFAVALVCGPASASDDPYESTNSGDAGIVENSLMAPCCFANTVAEHSSPLANQLKGEIREFVAEGQSVEQILSFYENKYGERILAAPKTSGFNVLAWVMPFVFVALGTVVCVVWLVRRRSTVETPEVAVGPSAVAPRSGTDDALVAKMEAELAKFD